MPTLETGTSRDDEIDQIRKDFTAEMEDQCRIYRVNTKAELQPDGTMGVESETEIYSGSCSVMPILARRDRQTEMGQGLVFALQYRLTLPWHAAGMRITDRVTVTVSRDLGFVGRNFEIRDIHRTTDITQRRITLHDLER